MCKLNLHNKSMDTKNVNFKDFLEKNLRKFAWQMTKDGKVSCSYGLTSLIKSHSKDIFLSTVLKYVQEFGIDNLIEQKPFIVHIAKFYDINVIEITQCICDCVGKEASQQFKVKKMWPRYAFIALCFFIFGFGCGLLF